MKKSCLRATIGVALGTAMIGTLSVATNAMAGTSPFTMKTLSSGYMVAGGPGGKCGASKCGGKKTKEGKCGAKKATHGKCSEGKCGEGKCGGKKAPMSKTPANSNCTNYDEDMCG